MTYGEIVDVIEHDYKRRKAEQEVATINAAFSAYHGAYLSRVKGSSFPRSLVKAFPTLFGRDASGNIPVENWQESKRAMARFAERARSAKGVVESG